MKYGVELFGQKHQVSFTPHGQQAVIDAGGNHHHNRGFLQAAHAYQDRQLSQQIDAVQKKATEELGFEVEYDHYHQKLTPRDRMLEADELEKMAEALQSVARQLRKIPSQEHDSAKALPAIVGRLKEACSGIDEEVVKAGEFAIYKSVGNNQNYFEQLERDPGLSKSVIAYQHEGIRLNNGRAVIQEALDACDGKGDNWLPIV